MNQKFKILNKYIRIFIYLFLTCYLIIPFSIQKIYAGVIRRSSCADAIRMDENYFKKLKLVQEIVFESKQEIIDKFIKMPLWAQWEYINQFNISEFHPTLSDLDIKASIKTFKECK